MGLAYRPEEGYWSAQNWAVAEVREYKTALLQEVISMFGPDGISLDFLRAPLFFNASTTTGEERRSVMGAWVRDLRRRMDAGGVPTLSARIPPKLETLDAIGLDIRGLVADGTLSFLTLGINYDSFMAQDSDIATIRKMVPSNYSLLWEVSYVERAKASAACHHGPDQRMTHAHLATSAHQAYFLGATGMASFNCKCSSSLCVFSTKKSLSEAGAQFNTTASLLTRRACCARTSLIPSRLLESSPGSGTVTGSPVRISSTGLTQHGTSSRARRCLRRLCWRLRKGRG